jgi:hypothetical protein
MKIAATTLCDTGCHILNRINNKSKKGILIAGSALFINLSCRIFKNK